MAMGATMELGWRAGGFDLAHYLTLVVCSLGAPGGARLEAWRIWSCWSNLDSDENSSCLPALAFLYFSFIFLL